MASWEVTEFDGTVESQHNVAFGVADVGPAPGRAVWLHHIDRPTVVLGSAQRVGDDVLARALRHDLAVARRRSGGGAVLLDAREVVWVDLIIPPHDSLWIDDIGASFHWVGETWRRVLATLGIEGSVHVGPLQRTPWSGAVCFAGVGSGEVLVDGRKVLGLSQRRTRNGARFQCALLLDWEPDRLVSTLFAEPEAGEALRAVTDVATGVAGVTAGDVIDRLLDELRALH